MYNVPQHNKLDTNLAYVYPCLSTSVHALHHFYTTFLETIALRPKVLPAAVGWLQLKELHVEGNLLLRIPAHVQKLGTPGMLCYLQILGEQHRMVEEHLSRFSQVSEG